LIKTDDQAGESSIALCEIVYLSLLSTLIHSLRRINLLALINLLTQSPFQGYNLLIS